MTMPIQRLAERGIVSLAVNNAGGYAPVKAWCFGDPQWKFHHGLFLDPAMLTFAPSGKLARCVRVKIDGEFCGTDIQLRHCPNTYGFARSGRFEPSDFLTDPAAHWGKSGRNDKEKGDRRRITTMLCGIRLLHYLGCRRVYMLGVDFKAASDGHRYAWEKRGGSGWRKMGLMLEELAPEFEKTGFDVYQCNPESECKVFPYVPFETALEDCRGAVPAEPFDLVEWYARRPFEESKKKPLMKYAEVLAKSCG